ncbi:Transposon Tf2-8 polyprotein [Dictyocoela roeselum]|nr:Transposon Tf2-8 polyprotein [Dictyocoela roeselum]
MKFIIVEKETQAIIKCLNHFKTLIYNTKIYIYGDNKNLTFNGPLTKRIERWKLTLEEYNYELIHIEGQNNKHADAFSRLYQHTEKESNDKYRPFFSSITINKLKSKLTDTTSNNEDREAARKKLKKEIEDIHKNLMHPGMIKMESLPKKYIKIPNTKPLIHQICQECHVCNFSKDYRRLFGSTVNKLSVTKTNECVALDIKGPIKIRHFKTNIKKKNFYILLITDLYSRFFEIGIIYNIRSDIITSFFEKY